MSYNPTGSDAVLYFSVAWQGKHQGFHLQWLSEKVIPVQSFCISVCICFYITGLTKLPLPRTEIQNKPAAETARKWLIFGISQYPHANTKLVNVELSLCLNKHNVMKMRMGVAT
jgi:hypothetical protein